MEKMSEKEFDIPEEPSVTSSDPNERKLGRRLRIQRRVEALKKHEGFEDVGIIEKSHTEKQIDTSAEILEKLIAEGEEVVSNVGVANDAREVDRREEDIAIRNRLLKKLDDEANECLKKYQIINEKWSSVLASKDPLDIHDGLESQSAMCEEILKRKDLLIEELRQELRNADEKFIVDQKKQSQDIDLLIERIENQVSTIAKAYRRELVLIEEALNSERSSLLESVSKRWDGLYKQCREGEINGVERRKNAMREYETEMKRVMIELEEKYRSEKIDLETESQNLEQEVQRMKAVCMMNIEKLDYNYAVLKRREDENTIIKNQQKRRINKLQDVINGLKKDYNDLEGKTRSEIKKLSDQVRKAHKNIKELEAKSDHFTRINEKQYFDIWDLSTRQADQLVEKIFTADKIIHEQILGLDWEPPELSLLKKEDLPSYRRATTEIQQRKAGIKESMKILKLDEQSTSLEHSNLERRLLSNILGKISDHTGFLIEDKLRELLAPHSYHDNIIIRLDNVFQALGITSEDQVDLLLNFFLPYSYCVICAINEDEESGSIVSGFEREKSPSEETAAGKIGPEDSKIEKGCRDRDDENEKTNVRESSEGEECEDSESIENTEGSIEKPRKIESGITFLQGSSDGCVSSSSVGRNVTCEKGHLLEIESANVTKALKEFAEKHGANGGNKILRPEEKLSSKEFTTTLSRSLTNEDVTNFWNRYRDIFSTKREKLWDGLLIGLQKYHGILKERHRLNNETECLRKQNAELKRLLETYVAKPENNALIPLGPRASNKSP